MDEATWLACTDPGRMLAFLDHGPSPRKRRLFACASCRAVWEMLTDPRSRLAVEVAEAYADGRATDAERHRVREEAWPARVGGPGDEHPGYMASVVCWPNDLSLADRVVAHGAFVDQAPTQAAILRDLFGPLPFRPVHVEAAWLAWEGGAVANLARAAYDNRALPAGTLDNTRLAILADALEEAGCAGADLPGHLRQGGPHYRGCFAVDLLLGLA